MAIVKKPIKKVPKAQVGRLIDKLVSKESNKLLDRVVKRPAGMTDKAVDYGKVVLTDAQKAKNAEILKNPGSATADSWARAKKVAKKETDAKWKGILNESKGEFNKPMTRPPGSPQTSTLARIARSIKATAKKAAPKSKNGSSIKKAPDGTKVVKGSRPGLGVFRTTKERTTSGGLFEPYKYKRESIDTTGYSKGRKNYNFKTVEGEADKLGLDKVTSSKSKTITRKDVPTTLKSLNKAKDGMWMQKAAASIKKRGTAGKCTPITKPGCTGKAKALAKTFKKIAKSNKKK